MKPTRDPGRPAIALLALALMLGCLSACGSSHRGPAVVSVGEDVLDGATVAHWAHALERGATPAGSSRAGRTPRQRALAFLISAAWLRGEAAALGVTPSASSVDHALGERSAGVGDAEFERGLREAGQSVEDARLEISAGLAAEAIKRRLGAQATQATRQQLLAYYKQNQARFHRPEVRVVDLIENLPSPAAAEALVARIGTGSRFSGRAYRETLMRRGSVSTATHEKAALVAAIFAARPGAASRPLRLNHAWTVFVLRRVVPAHTRPLAEVRASVLATLATHRRKQIRGAFIERYRSSWRARTHCTPGYVVPGCAQYVGPVPIGEDLFLAR